MASTSGNSSMSGSSRRQDSSDASSAPSVANLIDENDVYRIGYPAPLEALPLEADLLSPDSKLMQQYQLLKPHIQSILAAKGVRWTIMNPTVRYPRQKVPPHRCTILIDATKGDNDDATWTRALYECVQVLLINKALDFGIEIQDPRSVMSFYTPFCGPEVYHSWNNVLRPQMLEILQFDGWLAMTILRYGHEEACSPLAIVISTREDSTRDWAQVRRQIEEILNSSSYHFEIVFVRDSARAMMGLPRATTQSPSAFGGPVISGASIGPAGKQSSGTLGGYIKCRRRRDGLVKEFGLTNAHVVVPTNITDEEERNGIPEGDRAASITIVSPGELDTQGTIDSYHDNITMRETMIQGLEFKLNMGGDDERCRRRIDNHRSEVTKAVNEREMMRNGNFEFGKLLCSSGYTSVAGTTVVSDWALIDVKWPRLGLTFLPTPNSWDRGTGYAPMEATLSIATTVLTMYEKLFKKGRTTDQTWGTYSGFEVDLNFGFGLQKAWTVLGSGNIFLDDGDSGSFLYNCAGQLVGLAFGGPVDRNFGYFIPIKYVFDEINRTTEWEVISPEFI